MINELELPNKVTPIPGRSASRRAVKQLVMTLVLSLPIVSFAQPVILIDNLFAPGEGPAGVDNVAEIPSGTGYGVDFSTDGGTYSLNTLTLEFVLQSTVYAGFDPEIFTVGPSGSLNYPSVNLVPYGQFGNPTISPTPTQRPDLTTFINFTPTSPITLQPNTTYVIGFTVATNGSPYNNLRFGGVGYTYENPGGVNGDTYSYSATASAPTSVPFVPAGWSSEGGGEPILQLTATEVPEPGSWALAAIAVALAGAPRLRTRLRFVQSNP